MKIRHLANAALATAFLAGQTLAVPTIDGTADVEYGAAKSVQTTNTQFGNAIFGDVINGGGGSEIDQIYGTVSGGRLYVTITGNLEINFNKLDIYLDTKAGGVHSIVGAALPDQVDGYCCDGNEVGDGALQRSEGLTFDSGFNADYFLTFSNGRENLNGLEFYALSAHYADLTNGVNGATASAGMQLAPFGMPNVLRFPFDSDFTNNSISDGADLLVWQRNNGLAAGATRETGDATPLSMDFAVNGDDLAVFETEFGQVRALTDGPYAPGTGTPPTSALIGPALPGLTQGQLIDKVYAAAHPEIPELAFALAENRNMENTIDLRMAINNSNTAGVSGDGPFTDPTTETSVTSVKTGIEFSIPISQIGNPANGSTIKLTAFINGTGHDYASNQFSGAGILDGNPGGNGVGGYTGDLTGVILDDTLHNGTTVFAYLGDQSISIPIPAAVAAGGAIPEPASAALVLAALVGLGAARRRD